MPRGRAARIAWLVVLACALVAPHPASSATTQTLRSFVYLTRHQGRCHIYEYGGRTYYDYCTLKKWGRSRGPDLQGMGYSSEEGLDTDGTTVNYWHIGGAEPVYGGLSGDLTGASVQLGRLRTDHLAITGGFGAFAGATGTGTLECVLLRKNLRPFAHQQYCLLTLEVTLP